jgi:hypothetical protein
MVTNNCVHQFDNGFGPDCRRCLQLELDTKVQTEHSRVLHEAGTVRPDQILKEWLNESPAIDFDSVVEFKNALIGLVNRAACAVVGQNFVVTVVS